MTMAIGDLIEVTSEISLASEKGMNVFGYRVTDVTETDETTFFDLMLADLLVLVQEAVGGNCGEDAQLVCLTARRVPPGGATRIYTAFGDGTKSIQTKMGAGQLCLLLSKYSASGDEPKQGRIYWPFVTETLYTDGNVDDTHIAAIEADFQPFLRDEVVVPSAGTIKPSIIRLVTGLASVAADVIDLVLRPVLATQQRRVDHHQNFTPGP